MRETEAQTRVEAREVSISAGGVFLKGDLALPERARGVVLFAHGSGSSRHSPRNQFVAQRLQETGLATLLMDLLTLREEEEDARTARLRFDMGLLGRRLIAALDWLAEDARIRDRPVGCFGASSGAGSSSGPVPDCCGREGAKRPCARPRSRPRRRRARTRCERRLPESLPPDNARAACRALPFGSARRRATRS